MRHYEVVAVIHPDQQGRIAAMIEVYKKIVTDGGGVLHRLEDWGRRPLAYPIQNQHKAQYVLMNIECGDETLGKLRETFRFSDSIIRSLVVRCDRAI
ncbi:MAG: 30S ribosomal protein S6, partial [Gammaproteobacteria bacterium]